MKVRVAVNGYGVIGRRVADAVAKQDDMEVVGVCKVSPDYKALFALKKGFKLYAADGKGVEKFRKMGVDVSGTVVDMVKEADIIVDATPGDIGPQNKEMYAKASKKAIFQGGEEHGLTGFSFVAQCNYDQALGRQFVRVVSCNTTALCRVLHALDMAFGVEKARVVIARRAADPDEINRGPIDAVVLDPVTLPSHHGPDVKTVLPHINITTMALKVPTTHMHLHSLIVKLRDKTATAEKVREALRHTPRILLVSSKLGVKSTAHVYDIGREIGRERSDIFENIIWEDSLILEDSELYFFMGVHQEAIVIPENIDAIRAMFKIASCETSIQKTNTSLGITSSTIT
jgi:glyceraldehyde-3-phosphate dehydrogenase (NAD(P))